MKKFYARFRVFLMAFAFGVAVVWFFHNTQLENKEELKNATIVTIAKPPRFTETFRACGLGYVQGYESSDGLALTEGHLGCEERKAKRIIEKDDTKIVSEKGYKNGEVYYEIDLLETGHCINAPTKELGLELVDFLKNGLK